MEDGKTSGLIFIVYNDKQKSNKEMFESICFILIFLLRNI